MPLSLPAATRSWHRHQVLTWTFAAAALLLVCMVGTAAIATGGRVQLAVLGGALGVLLLVLSWRSRWLAFGVILLFGYLPLGALTKGAFAGSAGVVRIAALPFALVLAVTATRSVASRSSPAIPSLVWFAGGASLTILWSASTSDTVRAALGLITGVVSVIAIHRAFSAREFERAMAVVGAIVVYGSLLLLLVSRNTALVQGRLQGIFSNPNTLGTALILVMPFLYRRRRILLSPTLLLAIGCALMTASRATIVAVLAEALVVGLRSERQGARAATLAAAAIAAVLAFTVVGNTVNTKSPAYDPLNEQGLSASLVLERGDTRTDIWNQSYQVFIEHPVGGVGLAANSFEVGSSYLKLLVECGFVGVLLALWPLSWAVRGAVRNRGLASVVVAGGLANAAFEGWLFAGGSIFFVIFWTSVLAATAVDHPEHSSAATDALGVSGA